MNTLQEEKTTPHITVKVRIDETTFINPFNQLVELLPDGDYFVTLSNSKEEQDLIDKHLKSHSEK